MAIFGIGAYYDRDMSGEFISSGVAGPGWSKADAPELHQFIQSLKVGDIVYLKSFAPSSPDMLIKAIGLVADQHLVEDITVLSAGRNIKWVVTEEFRIPKPSERLNVRLNTMYEEFNPIVQAAIIGRLFGS
ncbi:hypothetical protein [Xanthomonas sp. LMG 12461]|uniref:hypothetical protein n=1 Tax=Xanthomonas sp. LMG 12461 TaxID=2014543 RepID=UPI001263FA15|nr:hypothetical protein [Xanthomonas sp. LMG 12461]KAB7769070.1 hypothetical protein CEK68_04595 [Xanthomonas sp. LMG 12461]